ALPRGRRRSRCAGGPCGPHRADESTTPTARRGAEPRSHDPGRAIRSDIMQKLDLIDQKSMKTDVPEFRAGDTVSVDVRVIEGSRSRIQVFKGVVIRRQGHGIRETFTVRKISFGVGVERTFPVHSPIIEKIDVNVRGDVRRAKLYYLRNLRGKAARIREKR